MHFSFTPNLNRPEFSGIARLLGLWPPCADVKFPAIPVGGPVPWHLFGTMVNLAMVMVLKKKKNKKSNGQGVLHFSSFPLPTPPVSFFMPFPPLIGRLINRQIDSCTTYAY